MKINRLLIISLSAAMAILPTANANPHPLESYKETIEELAEDYADRAIIAKVNVDQASSIAQQYSIRSIPALLFFKNGVVEQQLVGAVPKEEIVKIIDDLL